MVQVKHVIINFIVVTLKTGEINFNILIYIKYYFLVKSIFKIVETFYVIFILKTTKSGVYFLNLMYISIWTSHIFSF